MDQAVGDRTAHTLGPSQAKFDSTFVAATFLITVAVATRIVVWWNEAADVDDQFYLLVGQEILRGNWPYVDVWDRKPLGLFLLYAGIASVGGGSILGVNLIATVFATGTAWLIRSIGMHFSSAKAATLAAALYLVFLPLYGGQSGQTAVFYNMLMAGAAWLLFDAVRCTGISPVRKRAFAAMLLCGLSIFIKQVSFVEGAFFGLCFLYLLLRQGISIPRLVATGLLMIGIGLGPTAASIAAYWLAGPEAGLIYWHASFISIFHRQGWGIDSGAWGLVRFFLFLLPVIVMAVVGLYARRRSTDGLSRSFLTGWLAASFVGYAIVPDFFYHYALPVLVPLCVALSAFLHRSSGGLFAGALATAALIQGYSTDIAGHRRTQAEFSRLTRVVTSHLQGSCLYLSDGPTWLYETTSACRLTKFIFPDHLQLKSEANAIGINPAEERARIFAARPAVIVTQETKRFRYTAEANAMLSRELATNYRLVYRIPDDGPLPLDGIHVWQRNDLARPSQDF